MGLHVAPSPEDLPGWLARLDEGALERFGRAERPVVIAALHHRLLWIHPFADGNGTARLLSHALLRRTGVGSALWSVSRGLARHVEAYKSYLARADAPPQGALDGRGVLSDGRLADFCRFFMAACLDQVRFMRTLLSRRRFLTVCVSSSRLRRRGTAGCSSCTAFERAILFGELPRAEVPLLVGTSDRQARRLVQPLIARGLLTGAKDAPLRIAFPLGETERLFPYLWARSGIESEVAPLPEIEEALRLSQQQR